MVSFERGFFRGFLHAGAAGAAIISIIGAWHLLGMPTPAWSTDINRLEKQQTETAIDIYQRAVRGQLATQPPSDPVAKQNWDEELRQNRIRLDEAVKRRLELSK